LRDIFARTGNKRTIIEPECYPAAVVVFADLCGFSGYVRDTPRGRTIQTSLGSFCSKARHQIINDGGMLYQFLGDAVIGIFGVPDQPAGYEGRAFECARALLDIADSVSNEWQRRIDRLQPVRGAHVGMAIGELQFLPLRPFSRSHLGIIGDAINVAARLSNSAKSGEIVVSNSLRTQFPFATQQLLREIEPVEAKNVGRIKAWRFSNGASDCPK
jgi:class 3 adenylate cyclase